MFIADKNKNANLGMGACIMSCVKQIHSEVLLLFFFSHSFPSTFLSNNNQSSTTPVQSVSTPSVLASASASLPSVSNSIVTSGLSELKSSSGSRKARVLYDYDAANSSELSLLADEVRVFYVP